MGQDKLGGRFLSDDHVPVRRHRQQRRDDPVAQEARQEKEQPITEALHVLRECCKTSRRGWTRCRSWSKRCCSLAQGWQGTLLQGLAQERVLHLCIETVTDVGSCLIDGYLMRDASSYEDIIEIIGGEGVIQEGLAGSLMELVSSRRKLVQEYYEWPRYELHPFTARLPEWLSQFRAQVESYLEREQQQRAVA